MSGMAQGKYELITLSKVCLLVINTVKIDSPRVVPMVVVVWWLGGFDTRLSTLIICIVPRNNVGVIM